ncbi:MAG TPA: reverse transcriptase domain-containing protein [bacterium]|nr:reverse transcriptase domain-containing protein [bacterium]
MSQYFTQVINYDTLFFAWQRVLENHGCRGSDGVTIERFAENHEARIAALSKDLAAERYHPFPLLRFPVPKRHRASFRYLAVPTVRDRVAQAAVYLATKDLFEAEFENTSHAYREGRGLRTAFQQIRQWYDKGYRYAVDADIDAFFDNVDHDLLLGKLQKIIPEPELIRLFRKWISVEVYDGQRIWPLEKGIPQGSVVSPMLANLFLDELDEMFMAFDRRVVRFADDFLVLSKTESEADENIELTDMILEELQLKLNPVKTTIVSFDRGFKFLGSIFLHRTVYWPEWQKNSQDFQVHLPPALTLKSYLELRNR